MGIAAASSNDTPAGFGARRDSRAAASSAQAPDPVPNTSSPGANAVTAPPTASTRPARSAPTAGDAGLRKPPPRAKRGPVTPYHSTGFTEDACTRTSTWSSSIVGFSTSRSSSTSGRPYRSATIAFIVSTPSAMVVSRSIVTVDIPSSFDIHCKLTT